MPEKIEKAFISAVKYAIDIGSSSKIVELLLDSKVFRAYLKHDSGANIKSRIMLKHRYGKFFDYNLNI